MKNQKYGEKVRLDIYNQKFFLSQTPRSTVLIIEC